jgi:hypothetical protein
MFKNRTLLVVGAGASKEAGLPVGVELAEQISQLLTYRFDFRGLESGNPEFLRWLQRHFRDGEILNAHLRAGARIAKGVRRVGSIDNYIDTHQVDDCVATCGKAAIVHSIVSAERSSLIHANRDSGGHDVFDFERLEDKWFTHFGRLLVDQVRAANVKGVFNNLNIICFNYDRCIEEFLTHWLSAVYDIDLDQARMLVDGLPMIRPYGQVADFKSRNRPTGLEFGGNAERIDIGSLSDRIKTYTERVKNPDLLQRMHEAVAEAETIVFLGFAFAPQNLALITPKVGAKARRVYASAYGFSDTDVEDIKGSLDRFLRGSVDSDCVPRRARQRAPEVHVRNDLTCAGIFTEFRRSLSTALPPP